MGKRSLFTIQSSLSWQKVSCICVPIQIGQVIHTYKKEVKKINKEVIKNLLSTATIINQGKKSLLLPSS